MKPRSTALRTYVSPPSHPPSPSSSSPKSSKNPSFLFFSRATLNLIMMNSHKNALLPPLLLLLILISFFLSTHPISASNPTPLPSSSTTSYWTYFKAALHPIHSFFFPPPNLDFRGGSSADHPQSTSSGEVGGGGVTHAATKSLEKTKSTVEESAKSAAKLAKDAVQDTAQKVKDTLSGHPHPPEDSQDDDRTADL